MGSTRLPGKVLKPIGRDLLLGHILSRLQELHHPARVVVATTTRPGDAAIAAYCDLRGVVCFRGSEDDVLERFWQCAKQFDLDPIVRLTGDNPFPDIGELDRLIALHLTSGAQYTNSFRTLPVGVGAEIFSFYALERSHLEARASNQREHVNEFVLDNPLLFVTRELVVTGRKARPDIRLTVDTEEDYRKACRIAQEASSEPVSTEEAIQLCMRFA